jgi:hypothetical protein
MAKHILTTIILRFQASTIAARKDYLNRHYFCLSVILVIKGLSTLWDIPWYWSDGVNEVIYFVKSDGPTKSAGFLGSVGLYQVNHFIESVGQVPWDIPSCKRALRIRMQDAAWKETGWGPQGRSAGLAEFIGFRKVCSMGLIHLPNLLVKVLIDN